MNNSRDVVIDEVELQKVLTLGETVEGSGGPWKLSSAKSPTEADENSMTWISPHLKNASDLMSSTKAKVVICAEGATGNFGSRLVIRSAQPRLTFMRILRSFFADKVIPGIDPSAIVSKDASVHPAAFIGPGCVIGKAHIGKGAVLVSRVTVGDGVEIGSHARIESGVVLGSSGFGFSRNDTGGIEGFLHVGRVIVEEEVEIGANSVVDRGTLGATIIRKGTKIGALVNIGHNCDIGESALIAGNVTISGSTIIDKNAWIGPSAVLSNGIRLSEEAHLGIGAIVVKDVPPHAKLVAKPSQQLPKDFGLST